MSPTIPERTELFLCVVVLVVHLDDHEADGGQELGVGHGYGATLSS